MTLADQIADILRSHRGRESAITSAEIARELQLPRSAERTIRETISDEDWEEREMLVVAVPGFGFYLATDASEVDAYHALLCSLRDRAAAKVTTFVAACRRAGISLEKR